MRQDGFNLGLVPLLELDDGPGRECGEHGYRSQPSGGSRRVSIPRKGSSECGDASRVGLLEMAAEAFIGDKRAGGGALRRLDHQAPRRAAVRHSFGAKSCRSTGRWAADMRRTLRQAPPCYWPAEHR